MLALVAFSLVVPASASSTPRGLEVAKSPRGVVVCDEPLAAEIGARVLRKGGNAVDAAVAIAFALAVVEPTAGNIGGGGFMLVRMADGRQIFLDYRETAPRRATRNMYLDAAGELRPNASTLGPLAAGTPGTVAGMNEAHRRYGKLPWRDLLAPACQLASEGFRISQSQAGALKSDSKRLGSFALTRLRYLNGGAGFSEGERVRLPELGQTLERIRDHGADDFYRGKTARLIAEHMRRFGGWVDEKDLADYRVRVRKPLIGQYRGRTILTAPPPSSGGTAMLEMLNILELAPKEVSREHWMVEAMRLAFADRSELMGDPDFVRVPVSTLVSKRYAARVASTINPLAAGESTSVKPGARLGGEHRETTHFSVIDADGNAVANTYTLNGSFGCADAVEGAGFLLNNEMDDFAAKPGTPNMFGLIQGEKNAIAAGKRPLSSMTPTIVLRNGKVEMVLGSPGGPTIINTVLEVLLNRLDRELDPEESVRAPRLHHQWLPDVIVAESSYPEDKLETLRRLGHRVERRGKQGIANCIFVERATGIRIGVADLRYRDATAASE